MRLRYLRIASLMMCLATVPCTVRAQGSGFGVSVKSSVLAAAGDSITVSYIVRVLPSAHDSLTSFMVDAPGVIRVLMPGAKPEWTVGTRWRLRPVADWGKLSHLITPGDSTPPLQYTAHGMLDVVQYWAELDAPLDSLITETPPDSSLSADTTVTIKGSKGFTIGVGAMPADLSSAALTIRTWLDRQPWRVQQPEGQSGSKIGTSECHAERTRRTAGQACVRRCVSAPITQCKRVAHVSIRQL
jgi:hypothetical protein